MKRESLIFCTIACLALASALAQPALASGTGEALEALRAQLQALSQRLDDLERANTDLRAENERLRQTQASDGARIAELAEAAESVSQRLDDDSESSWTDRIRWKGDVRLRQETIDQAGRDRRNRTRVRARAAMIANVSDDVEVGVGIASGGDSPTSTNQTIGDGGSSKGLNLDLAYVNWSASEEVTLTGGKFKNLLYRPGGNGLLWDSDWNPEGIGLAWQKDSMFANLLGTWLESDSRRTTEFSYGVQAGYRVGLGSAELTAGIAYYEIGTAGKGTFFGDDDEFFGNSFDAAANTYLYDYEELELFADLGFDIAGTPANVFFDYVKNLDAPDHDTGYALGIAYGAAKAPGTWEFIYTYQRLEADAVFGLLTDSNFGGGGTDARGHVLEGGYAIAPGVTASVTYFSNEQGISDGPGRDYDRLQLDVSFKY